EVLSPSTRRKDMVVKLEKYRNCGVREYWIIDPKKKLLFCYDFEHGKEQTCSLEGEHGLAIYRGEIRVNLSELGQKILERENRKRRKEVIYYTEGGQEMGGVEEDTQQYLVNPKSEYTIEDYFALPDDRWAELIDGYFYEMETPSVMHQEIAMNLLIQICSQVKERGDKLFTLRTSVQLDCDEKTMMLPDMMIICDRDKQKKKVIYGAPDFVLEVLSPFTRKKDLIIKHRKYLNAGVREYWIIDPEENRLITYDFENGENVASYPFTEVVGLSIYEKEISVDLRELAEILEE
ncbi:MAG: Uma2 family endonuclease, partial [Lachnospiraceae bacterium]|nr:Uma2 family endonuclease [Lachnospiraceae bacterium]